MNCAAPSADAHWDELAEGHDLDLAVARHSDPPSFQAELAELVTRLTAGPSTVLEAGSFIGETSALLPNQIEKVLLDLSPAALAKAQTFYAELGTSASFVKGDLFEMPFEDEVFDLTFNSGVLEHFEADLRSRAVSEMARVTRPGGWIVVAVPNHDSVPYRTGYLWALRNGSWPYPLEMHVKDMDLEFVGADLGRPAVATMSSDLRWEYLRGWPVRRLLWRQWEKLRGNDYEGYLKVFYAQKRTVPGVR